MPTAVLRDPHATQPVFQSGIPLEQASVAAILLHGRGADAADMISLSGVFKVDGVTYLVPEAAQNTWYPNTFLADLESNEPHLSSALSKVASILRTIEEAGIPAERVMLAGFSQGACLALEFAARNPREYGAVVALSGGLIGPAGLTRTDTGSLEGTPVFLGCSDRDPHIPRSRVEESAEILRALGGEVDLNIYPGLGHTINNDEIIQIRELLTALTPKRNHES